MSHVFRLLMGALFSVSAVAAVSWSPYKNQKLGFEIYYPQDFIERTDVTDGSGKTFVSPDGSMQIKGYAAIDDWALGAKYYLERNIQQKGQLHSALATRVHAGDNEPFREILEIQTNDYSITLRGRRGHQLYLEEILFSCKDKVVNVLSISYDESRAGDYQLLVDKIRAKFHAGSGTDSPICL